MIPTETPPKIVTGTIALKVGDVNDNCPVLTHNVEYVCSDTEVINITAVDEDGEPNSAPFSFSLVPESQKEWSIEPLNGMVPYFSTVFFEQLFFQILDEWIRCKIPSERKSAHVTR